MTFEYWYLFPVAILVAVTTMASGVGGATFFTPIFIIGPITEVFGFISGIFAYARKRHIDYRLGLTLLVATVPLALIGTWVAGGVDSDILKVILGVGLFVVAVSFLRSPDHRDVMVMNAAIEEEYGGEKAETCLVTAEGEQICYTVCNRNEGRLIAGVGGLFVGMISTGLGELNGYFLLQRCRVPSAVSVATTVFVVAVTASAAATGHMAQFLQAGRDTMQTVISIVIFTVPGVIIDAQLGAKVAGRISQDMLERALGVLFIIEAAVTLAEVIL
jgi:uncharacterized membrane protein YfcA